MSETLSRDEVVELVGEKVAAQIHDTWIAEKTKAKYTVGSPRNDDPEKGDLVHPDMIPYEELTEQKKEWDRATGRAAVSGVYDAILALGFEIVRKL